MAEKEEKKQEAGREAEAEEVKATPVEKHSAGDVERTRGETFVAPDVDIYEQDDSLVLVADVPGVGADGVEVRLESGVLEVTAHAGRGRSDEADYVEYRPASYHRAFSLSEDIDAEKIAARVKHGVLTITLPKSERAKPRKIDVTAG